MPTGTIFAHAVVISSVVEHPGGKSGSSRRTHHVKEYTSERHPPRSELWRGCVLARNADRFIAAGCRLFRSREDIHGPVRFLTPETTIARRDRTRSRLTRAYEIGRMGHIEGSRSRCRARAMTRTSRAVRSPPPFLIDIVSGEVPHRGTYGPSRGF